MLPAPHRMRHSPEFAATIRRGGRSSGRYLVVHARLADDPTPAEAARVGFVVSKAVGGAVQRNKVRRRLRAAVAQFVTELPAQLCVVVRARPTAVAASFAELDGEVRQLVDRTSARAAGDGAI